ncbi:hypothetical protein BO85DRAFT_239696 [Aspergillus piperis CBS 112811]|uniref:Uncharacterized protein n=1 Tax=Aspergillus piperis CBS 112811 TaxID=1448313 RepID=A0A8G1QSI4_9EURO|nr:hypothetical protein BO85DRAFT_239696 [Aspergillus piperis CBS 112811]RAH51779.1 hypothetical protein BO85DRAFT_239696 [Aspergillus piperis CBS 112811]
MRLSPPPRGGHFAEGPAAPHSVGCSSATFLGGGRRMVDYYHQTFFIMAFIFFSCLQNSDSDGEGPAQSYYQSASDQCKCKCQVPNLKLLSPPLAI